MVRLCRADRQVAEALAGARGVELEALAADVYTNTLRLFFPDELHDATAQCVGDEKVDEKVDE